MAKRKVFTDSVIPLPKNVGVVHEGLMLNAALPEHKAEHMPLLFSLEIPKKARERMERAVERGEVLSPDQLAASSANAKQLAKLRAWLTKEGFEIDHVSPDGTSVYAKASVDQIEKSLGVRMIRVTKDGFTYTATQNAPSLPADVGAGVHAVIGLQPFRQAHKNSRKCVPHHVNRTPAAASSRSKKTQSTPPYLVSEILKAYNADGLSLTGKGQTIAILIDTHPLQDDLKTFWAENGLSTSVGQIAMVNVSGDPLPPPEGEESLDAEWASGIAPGANVRIYASGSLRFVDLDRALDQIIADLPGHPEMRQLSISLGLGERYMGGPQGEVAVQHQKFLRLAAAGVNVFVSSGDAGSNPDESGHSPTGVTQAEYESSDPSVIGVGGTTLRLAADGTVASETGWTGGGGGKSIFFPRPAWQKGSGVTGTKRLVPDVSLTADPNFGALLILHGKTMQIGGTSWSAPVWAGFCALLNEARAKAKQPALPYLNPLIYPLIGTAAFRDITSGSNGAYNAKKGYDMVGGIGVPNMKELVASLTRPSLA
jgi:kumamolisin